MDAYFAVSLVVGVVSIVLAVVAIWYSTQAEKKSADSYNQTKEVLAAISEKAAVIQETVNTTQQKLVDTITEIAKPPRDTEQDIFLKTLLPAMLDNPELMERLIKLGSQQEQRDEGPG